VTDEGVTKIITDVIAGMADGMYGKKVLLKFAEDL
jgi:hypothetical protein